MNTQKPLIKSFFDEVTHTFTYVVSDPILTKRDY
jgi:hypothetical protein